MEILLRIILTFSPVWTIFLGIFILKSGIVTILLFLLSFPMFFLGIASTKNKKVCPYCKEVINKNATVCPRCCRDLKHL